MMPCTELVQDLGEGQQPACSPILSGDSLDGSGGAPKDSMAGTNNNTIPRFCDSKGRHVLSLWDGVGGFCLWPYQETKSKLQGIWWKVVTSKWTDC